MLTTLQPAIEKLNPAQRESVETVEGPVMVLAGPGTGKTQILTLRVANILEQTDAQASEILCLTFTEAAAHNMRQRLSTFIGGDAYKVSIHTFHSLGTEIINQNPSYFHLGANFQPIDELGQVQIIQEILEKLPLTDPLSSFHPELGWTYRQDILYNISEFKKAGLNDKEILDICQKNEKFLETINSQFSSIFEKRIDKIKVTDFNEVLTLVQEYEEDSKVKNFGEFALYSQMFLEVLQDLTQSFEKNKLKLFRSKFLKKDENNNFIFKDLFNIEKIRSLSRVYRLYQEKLFKKGQFDFDDMLMEVIRVFEQTPDIRYDFQEKFQYILVDEFQDTSNIQMKLIQQFLNPAVDNNRPNFMVVGDDDQSIYKFQGANLQNFIDFQNTFDAVKVIVLTQNYRSTQDILDFSQEILQNLSQRIGNNSSTPKELISMKTEKIEKSV